MRNVFIMGGLAATLVFGGAGCLSPGVSAEQLEAARQRAFDEGREAGKKEMAETINQKFVAQGLSSPLDKPIMQVYGQVKDVSGNSFMIEYDSAQLTVIDSGVMMKRVTLASGATVEKMVPKPAEKPPAGQQGALGGVAAKPPAPGGSLGQLDSAPTGPLGPSAILSVATKVSISELKAGDYVRIIATNDVRTSAAIEASSVTIYDISNIPAEAASDPSQLPFSRTNDLPYLPTPTEPPASPAPGGVMPTPDAGTAPQPGSSTGAAATPPTTEPTAGGSVASPPSPTP